MTERYYNNEVLEAALQGASYTEGRRENILATEVHALRAEVEQLREDLRCVSLVRDDKSARWEQALKESAGLRAEVERLQRAAVPGNAPEMLRMQVALKRADTMIARLRSLVSDQATHLRKIRDDYHEQLDRNAELRDKLDAAMDWCTAAKQSHVCRCAEEMHERVRQAQQMHERVRQAQMHERVRQRGKCWACGRTYAEHRDKPDPHATPRMPCAGLKANFAVDAKLTRKGNGARHGAQGEPATGIPPADPQSAGPLETPSAVPFVAEHERIAWLENALHETESILVEHGFMHDEERFDATDQVETT